MRNLTLSILLIFAFSAFAGKIYNISSPDGKQFKINLAPGGGFAMIIK